eukprot:CAMPEP_0194160688 /NCGR_PEP_ID=MMETSP0152-20130528/78528_1 /TAXON_ID=1049557 /ORGANISM="Thalassiothrix antarctica, Strain L6-D1" /LENGTH=195 /DNA_ID=CAMNT_0038870397 /DNA_START=691 /DNA_END=1278 /DNA_ORIENTATION=-
MERYQAASECQSIVLKYLKLKAKRQVPVLTYRKEYNKLGKIQEKMGNFEDAKMSYQAVIEILEGRGYSETLDMAKAITKLGEVSRLMGQLDEASEYFQESLRLYRLNIGEFPWQSSVARLHESIGDIALEQQQKVSPLTSEQKQIIENYEFALEIYRRAGKSDTENALKKLMEKISSLKDPTAESIPNEGTPEIV